jgi:hypothetical protein
VELLKRILRLFWLHAELVPGEWLEEPMARPELTPERRAWEWRNEFGDDSKGFTAGPPPGGP